MILIIGGAGFIGKHLCRQLHQKSLDAISVSRQQNQDFLPAHAPSVLQCSLAELYAGDLNTLLPSVRTIVYLASSSVPAKKDNSAAIELSGNVNRLVELSDFLSPKVADAHIIYLSSGGTVYNNRDTTPAKETDAISGHTPYAFGKIVMEQYLSHRLSYQRLPFTVLRPSNPVGEWQDNTQQGLISVGLRAIKSNSHVDIYGDGLAVRDYFDVNDLCRAIIICAENKAVCIGKTWNIGSGKGHTTLDILNVLEEVTGKKIERRFKSSRVTDVPYSVLNVDLIHDDLGWFCKTELNEVISRIWSSMTL